MSQRPARRSARTPRAGRRAAARVWWRRPRIYVPALGVALLVVVALAVRGADGGAAPGSVAEAAVPCSGAEMTRYHIHAHIEIDIRGARQTVPGDVGHRPTCLYWLHTHDDTGLIHVEADVAVNYTLGQFFTVWDQQLSQEQVLGERVGPGEEVRVLVDGQPFMGDPRSVPLTPHEQIVVQLGPKFPAPQPFTFPPGS